MIHYFSMSMFDVYFDGFRENEINKDYIAETQNGPTISFRSTSYEISSKCEEMSTIVQQVQGNITKIRNQFKERMV